MQAESSPLSVMFRLAEEPGTRAQQFGDVMVHCGYLDFRFVLPWEQQAQVLREASQSNVSSQY